MDADLVDIIDYFKKKGDEYSAELIIHEKSKVERLATIERRKKEVARLEANDAKVQGGMKKLMDKMQMEMAEAHRRAMFCITAEQSDLAHDLKMLEDTERLMVEVKDKQAMMRREGEK